MRIRPQLITAIDRLADQVENGHLLASMGGEDLLMAAADEIDRLRAELAANAALLAQQAEPGRVAGLRQLQDEQQEWGRLNFGDRPWQQPFLGVVEEVGELSHALLKQWQGIRGTHDEHEVAAQDAVGDIVVFLAALCSARGWDLEAIVEETWTRVKRRDWKADSAQGHSGALYPSAARLKGSKPGEGP